MAEPTDIDTTTPEERGAASDDHPTAPAATAAAPAATSSAMPAKWFAGGAAAGGIVGLAVGALVGLLIGLAVGIPLDEPVDERPPVTQLEAPAPGDDLEEQLREHLEDERLEDGLDGLDGGQPGN